MQATTFIGGAGMRCAVRRSSRARRISVTVGNDGAVAVTLPRRASVAAAERFLADKERWIARARARAMRCVSVGAADTPTSYKEHKRRAERVIAGRVEYFNRFYRLTFRSISVRNQKTRWGSCSSRKNLQFNYRLIFLPPHLLDYVVVHELCHLAIANHGARFRASIAKVMPDHKAHERQLRQYRIS